jgi:hypothetical protein
MQYYDVYQRYVFGKQLNKYAMFINDTSLVNYSTKIRCHQRYAFDAPNKNEIFCVGYLRNKLDMI